eukprot:TRINITY_DN49043_c0_g1_i1.p1 TRINITY_DN49043_c0_g1~~TRINITY_DN49043_c0_g1_i1.p1  ORF type:complete len:586 (+),score=92.37 TRINITY_DN49043_c0_g1_i1:57-1760(+)
MRVCWLVVRSRVFFQCCFFYVQSWQSRRGEARPRCAMAGRNGVAADAPTRCAECGAALTDALVLTCDHDLCLSCAASALRQTRSPTGRMVRCLLCSATTELCDEAMGALQGHLQQPEWPARPSRLSDDSSLAPPRGGGNESMSDSSTPSRLHANGQGSLSLSRSFADSHAEYQPMAALARNGHQSYARQSAARAPPAGVPYAEQRKVPAAVSGAPSSPLLHAPIALELPDTCAEHPGEMATYFCVTCECPCICSECIVHGPHRTHEVLRVDRAHEALRARAGSLVDEALALEDEFALVTDKLAWRRKDIERAATRGRASVRSAFARVRAQLVEREAELLESLDAYEADSLARLDRSSSDHDGRLDELRGMQDALRSRCARSEDAVAALNAYARCKASMLRLREAFRQDEMAAAPSPDDFVHIAADARAELDSHQQGLASLEEAVASLCERGNEFQMQAANRPLVSPNADVNRSGSGSPNRKLAAGGGGSFAGPTSPGARDAAIKAAPLTNGRTDGYGMMGAPAAAPGPGPGFRPLASPSLQGPRKEDRSRAPLMGGGMERLEQRRFY